MRRDAYLFRSTEKVQSVGGVVRVFVRTDVRVDGVEQLCEQDLAKHLRVHSRHAACIRCVERLELRAGVLLAQGHVGACSGPAPVLFGAHVASIKKKMAAKGRLRLCDS